MVETLERRILMADVMLDRVGGYDHGGFAEGAAEITAYEASSERLFVVNAESDTVDILNLANPTDPSLITTIDTSALGSPNSVATRPGLVAVAIANHDVQLPGVVAFYETSGTLIKTLVVGALPDMLTFSPDGRHLLVANEGEPSSYNQSDSVDPEGSVTAIKMPLSNADVRKLKQRDVRTASFAGFNSQKAALLAAGVRIYGPNATVAQDFEPEYIAVSADSTLAYVTLQENNAFATIDLKTAKVLSVTPFGYKDWSTSALDASDRDNTINIQPWLVFGMYQPDAISTISAGGQTYLVTANEGDARDYDGFAEEARVSSLTLDPTAFSNAAALKNNAAFGRLNVTKALGDTDGDGDYDGLYTLGGRSFSVWTTAGQLVFDSGYTLEQLVAEAFPPFFNASNEDNAFDSRSDNKGPEPEGLTVGVIAGRTYAFIGLERMGGVVVYDLTNPISPTFVQYINPRDFTAAVDSLAAGDLGPEGLTFISAADSPTGTAMLVVANEISGTTSVYEIGPATATSQASRQRRDATHLFVQRTTLADEIFEGERDVFTGTTATRFP